MCIDNVGALIVAKEDIVAYKVVRVSKGRYYSQFPVLDRIKQSGYRGHGRVRRYDLGTTLRVNMDRTPGLYVHATLRDAKFRLGSTMVILRVRIPAGARMREGVFDPYARRSSMVVYLVETLDVLGVAWPHDYE